MIRQNKDKGLAAPSDALDSVLAKYRISIDASDLAIDAMVRAARIRAVHLKDELSEAGFFGLVAQVLGFRRASGAMWSAIAGMTVALVIGVSLGASHTLPSGDETAFSIDFDSLMGVGTLPAPTADQDL